MYQPLADKLRPQTLDDVVGQRHLLGPNGLLRRVIESGNIPNLTRASGSIFVLARSAT